MDVYSIFQYSIQRKMAFIALEAKYPAQIWRMVIEIHKCTFVVQALKRVGQFHPFFPSICALSHLDVFDSFEAELEVLQR